MLQKAKKPSICYEPPQTEGKHDALFVWSACIFKDSCRENFLSKDSLWATVISGLLTVQLSSLAALGDNLQNNRPSLLFLHCAMWESPSEDVDRKSFLQSYLFTKHRPASLAE